MSERALETYEAALYAQHSRNEARRIRTRVNEARQNPHSAGFRWPFELLQNALDAGPRPGRSSVTVRIEREANIVRFEHDGAPFKLLELAALLSGGSSKEFESEVTTGRFGTGFLVTHVLSESTRLNGLLELDTGLELFDLSLNRRGNEDEILEDIQSSRDAIGAAIRMSNLDHIPSAVFEYQISDTEVWDLGLEALRTALPYLYATRPNLGRVELRSPDRPAEDWVPGESKEIEIQGGHALDRPFLVSTDAETVSRHAIRFSETESATAAAIVVIQNLDNEYNLLIPPRNSPRIYREYPLRSSGFLLANFVIDGKFESDQERSRLLMSAEDKNLLRAAFGSAVLAVNYAFAQEWKGAHHLCRLELHDHGFDSTDPQETLWWKEQLRNIAGRLSVLPLVYCDLGLLPAQADDGPYADFIVPTLGELEGGKTTDDRAWQLASEVEELCPPIKALSPDWTRIAIGWNTLGLDLKLIYLKGLPDWVKSDSKELSKLRVTVDPLAWIAHFIDVVGECWAQSKKVDAAILDGLLPNQNDLLCNANDLSRDGGIPDTLKVLCTRFGYDVRGKLLLEGLSQEHAIPGLIYLLRAIEDAIPARLSEEAVVESALQYLGKKLPQDENYDPESQLLQPTAQFLTYLWTTRGHRASQMARQVPLINSQSRVARWSKERMLMAPVSAWPQSAQAFFGAYPPSRILHEDYLALSGISPSKFVEALKVWDVVIADMIVDDVPAELNSPRCNARREVLIGSFSSTSWASSV